MSVKSPARFVLHEHRARPATVGEVEEYLCALLGRDLWAQRAVIPSRLTIAGELHNKNLVIDCYRDDLKEIDMKAPLSSHPDEEIIIRGGFPLMLADWLLVVCDPMRDLFDQRLENAFPSVPLFLLYHRLRDLAVFLKTLDSKEQNRQGLAEIAETLRAAMMDIPLHIPFSRLAEAIQKFGYRTGEEIFEPVAIACWNARGNGPNSIGAKLPTPFFSQEPADSAQRMAAWLVTRHTLANWADRCPW